MKKAKKGVTRDYNDCTQPEISKRGICTCFVKKPFGKISAQRLVNFRESLVTLSVFLHNIPKD
jgi:hypothetical protein